VREVWGVQTLSENDQTSDQGQAPPPSPAPPRHHHFGLALIAVFKLIKGFLLLAAAIGLLQFIHADLSATVESWITFLKLDPERHFFRWVLEKVGAITPGEMKTVTMISFCYSALLLTEGIGLWLERRWAEYLTVIATSSFIPLEIFEVAQRFNELRVLVLVINLAILLYLIRTLRRQRKHRM